MPVFRSPRTTVRARPLASNLARVQDRPVRVLAVAARFLPDVGGTETHIYEITRRLAKRGNFDLTVLTTDRAGDRPTTQELEEFVVKRCRAYPRRRDYYLAPGIYSEVLRGDDDIIHCQGIHTAVPVLAMIAARRRALPYVVTLHTGGHSSSFRQRLRTSQWRLLASLLRGAAVIMAVSRFEQEIFQKTCHLDPSHFRVIQNGGNLPGVPEQLTVIPGRIVSSGRLLSDIKAINALLKRCQLCAARFQRQHYVFWDRVPTQVACSLS